MEGEFNGSCKNKSKELAKSYQQFVGFLIGLWPS